jgi:hypothetical protein
LVAVMENGRNFGRGSFKHQTFLGILMADPSFPADERAVIPEIMVQELGLRLALSEFEFATDKLELPVLLAIQETLPEFPPESSGIRVKASGEQLANYRKKLDSRIRSLSESDSDPAPAQPTGSAR